MLWNFIERVSPTLFGIVCHQNPDFLIGAGGETLPICPRCFGFHLGFTIATVFILLGIRSSMRFPGWIESLLLPALIFLPAVHWAGGYLGYYNPGIGSRFITGSIGGGGIACFMVGYMFRCSGKIGACRMRLSAVYTFVLLIVNLMLGQLIFRGYDAAELTQLAFFSIVFNAVTLCVLVTYVVYSNVSRRRSFPIKLKSNRG